MSTLQRSELVDRISKKLGCTKIDTRLFIEAYESVLREAIIEDKKIIIKGICVISLKDVLPTTRYNVRLRKTATSKYHKKVVFDTNKQLKKIIKDNTIK